jgi:hypothetical protein
MTTNRQEKIKTLKEVRENIMGTRIKIEQMKSSIEQGEAIIVILMQLEQDLENHLFGEES